MTEKLLPFPDRSREIYACDVVWGYFPLTETLYTATYFPSYKPFKLDIQALLGTAVEAETNSKVKFSSGQPHMDTPVLTEQQKLIFICSEWILDASYETCQEWWPIGTDCKRESKETVL